jgi:hypothetical protein
VLTSGDQAVAGDRILTGQQIPSGPYGGKSKLPAIAFWFDLRNSLFSWHRLRRL